MKGTKYLSIDGRIETYRQKCCTTLTEWPVTDSHSLSFNICQRNMEIQEGYLKMV
jgi:hypothetical protein